MGFSSLFVWEPLSRTDLGLEYFWMCVCFNCCLPNSCLNDSLSLNLCLQHVSGRWKYVAASSSAPSRMMGSLLLPWTCLLTGRPVLADAWEGGWCYSQVINALFNPKPMAGKRKKKRGSKWEKTSVTESMKQLFIITLFCVHWYIFILNVITCEDDIMLSWVWGI